MITKQAKSFTAPLSAIALTHKLRSSINDVDENLLRRKMHKGTRYNVHKGILSNAIHEANKLGDLATQLSDDIGRPELKKTKAFVLGIRPTFEALGAYLANKKLENKLKKEAGLFDAATGVANLASTFGSPVYGVASGQSSVGETAGKITGGIIGGGGLYKLMDPLIKAMPHGVLRGAARVGQFVGSSLAGGYMSDKLGNIGKKMPIYKRPNYDTIQHYNETGEIN